MKRLGSPPYICLITPGRVTSENYESEKRDTLETIREAVSDGVNLIQIREKQIAARLLFELVSESVEAVHGSPALIFVNDRADVAIAAGADGVHLAEKSLAPQVVRIAFGKSLSIGVSVHSAESARAAADAGANLVLFGPVFDTPGKGRPQGLEELTRVCRELDPFPVVAIGGIDQDNVSEIMRAGAAGIAAIRSLNVRSSRIAISNSLSANTRVLR